MSALEERIAALEDVVRHVKKAWNDVIMERDRFAAENNALRKRLTEIEGRMQDLTQKESLQDREVGYGRENDKGALLDAKKEIRTYIAEIDRCLETLNSI